MAASSLPQIECIICNEPFDATSVIPLLLKCGHTFCQADLQQLGKKNDEGTVVKCPTCQKLTQLTGDETLNKNYTLLEHIDVLQQAGHRPFAPVLKNAGLPSGEIYSIALDLGTARSALSIWIQKDDQHLRLDVSPDSCQTVTKVDCKTESILVFSSAQALGTRDKPLTVDSPATNLVFTRDSAKDEWVGVGPLAIENAETVISSTPPGETRGTAYTVRDFKMELDILSKRRQNPAEAAEIEPFPLYDIDVTAYPVHEDGEPIQVKLHLVMAAFIACAARFAFGRLAEYILKHQAGGENPIKLTMPSKSDIKWVITVPAIWTDQARLFMREAAFAAGLSQDVDSDSITICLEPEAAMLEAIKTGLIRNPSFLYDKSILVLDWGGGTCDITFSIVKPTRSQTVAELQEIVPALGGPYGGRMLNELVNNTIFRAWFGEELFKTWLNCGFRDRFFRNCFEEQKVATLDAGWRFAFNDLFQGSVPNEELTRRLEEFNETRDAPRRLHPFKIRAQPWFEIPFSLVEQFFNQCIDPVLELIEPLVKHETSPPAHIFVVGGMGQSPYLQQYLKKSWLPEKKLVFPEQAGMTIVRGAARFPLDSSLMVTRRARTNYGTYVVSKEDPTRRWSLLIEKGKLLSEIANASLGIFRPLWPTQTSVRTKIIECSQPIADDQPLTVDCCWVTEALTQLNMEAEFSQRRIEVGLSMAGPVISGTITDLSNGNKTPIKWTSH